MKKTAYLSLMLLLAATALLFLGCDLLTEPFPRETYNDTVICYPDTEEGSNIHIHPETMPVTEPVTELGDPFADLSEDERRIREIADAALSEAYELPAWEHFRITIDYGSNGNTNIYVKYEFRLRGYHTYESYDVTLAADQSVKKVKGYNVGEYSRYLKGATAEAFAAAEASLNEQIKAYGKEGSGYYLTVDNEDYLCLSYEIIVPVENPVDSGVGCGDHEHVFLNARICAAPTNPETEPPTELATELPTEPATELPTEPATEPPTEPETVYVPDIRFGYGTIVEYPYEEPMDSVWAIRDYTGDPWIIRLVYFDAPSVDFCVGDEVEFAYDANAEVKGSVDGVPILVALTMDFIPVAVPEKPVIYLYPETPTEVSVKLTIDGRLTCTYPAYDKGWDNFTAHPDGTLVFPDGKQYYCLYWEGIQNMDCDFTRGFCVKGSDTAEFLEWALAEQGLTPREANEFIIYWLPRMERNPYNVIAFQTEAYTEGAVLEIDPNPDSLLRVFMAYYPTDEAVEIPSQEFTPFERVGFTVVEWGGCEQKKN